MAVDNTLDTYNSTQQPTKEGIKTYMNVLIEKRKVNKPKPKIHPKRNPICCFILHETSKKPIK